jgi:hypothetical protein
MLCSRSISADTLDTLRRIQAQAELKDTRLVGGTALALQLGHRLSVDLDFFGVWDRTIDLLEIMKRCGPVITEHMTENIRVYILSGIKVDIVRYECTWLKPPLEYDRIRMAALEDIAPMKLEAVSSRGSKKDFIDIGFLLNRFSLKQMLDWYQLKYPQGSEYLILRSLVYFDDAEDDPMPIMLEPMEWAETKQIIQDAVRAYSIST